LELVDGMGNVCDLEFIKRMEGFVMNYEEMEQILRKNTGMLPRTWSEAKRDADYACWVDVPKREWQDALEFGAGILFMLPFLGIGFYVLWVVLGEVK
jgi:hypothetical protein